MYPSKTLLLMILIFIFIVVVSIRNTIQSQKEQKQRHQRQKGHLEGFYVNNYDETRKWSPEIIQEFLNVQQSLNDNTQIQFDMDQVQNQATEEEAKYFIEHKRWNWTEEVKRLYMDAVMNNPYIRSDPQESLDYVMTIYNQTAILEVISIFQTKEGDFLINGYQKEGEIDTALSGSGTYAVNAGLESRSNKLIRCKYNPSKPLPPYSASAPSTDTSQNREPSPPSSPSVLQEIETYGPFTIKTTDITENETIPKIIPGFTFLNEPCNPCIALDESPNKYSCPFIIKNVDTNMNINMNTMIDTNSNTNMNINMGRTDYPSQVWEYLWFSNPENKIKREENKKVSDNDMWNMIVNIFRGNK
jgi:hypothetical protein